MLPTFDLRVYALVGIIALAAGLGLGAAGMRHYDGLRHDKVVSDLNADHAKKLAAVSDAATVQAREAALELQGKSRSVAALDARYTKEMNDAKAEIARLRTAVDAGIIKLRIAAKAAHPASRPGVPATAGASGMDDGPVELADSARQAYFDLRMSIAEDQKKIAALQLYVTDVCRPDAGQ